MTAEGAIGILVLALVWHYVVSLLALQKELSKLHKQMLAELEKSIAEMEGRAGNQRYKR